MKIFSSLLQGSILAELQRFGRAVMLPIAVLPAAGLMLGIGGTLSNPDTLKAFNVFDVQWLQIIFHLMSAAGNIVFANLPVMFAVGLSTGLSRRDKGTVGLSAVLSMLITNSTINAALTLTGRLAEKDFALEGQGMCLGIQTLDTGVFGGILIGLMTYWLHDKFYRTELPVVFGFFSGSRFVPIICAVASIGLGISLYVLWPGLQRIIFSFGNLFAETGYIGTLFYGFFLRMLGLFGLHHMFYLPFWTTALGGSEIINGELIEGTQRIFFAQLGDPTVTKFYEGISRFMSGRFITMMFGLVGAAFAMYRTAKPENRKAVFGILLSAALTSFLTGIIENC